jgi:hypothetical protein
MGRPRTSPPRVPETRSQLALAVWLNQIGQQKAAELTKVPQSSLCAYATRQMRPSGGRMRILALASNGEVPADGWETPEEQQARQELEKKLSRLNRGKRRVA